MNMLKVHIKIRGLLEYHLSSVVKYFNKWGWVWDLDRKIINKRILDNLKNV